IVQLEAFFDTVNPPSIVGFSVIFPCIDWIAPKLTVITKFISWYTCDAKWILFSIYFEEFRHCPNFYTVCRNVNWHISNDLDAFLVSITFQFSPLLIEEILGYFVV